MLEAEPHAKTPRKELRRSASLNRAEKDGDIGNQRSRPTLLKSCRRGVDQESPRPLNRYPLLAWEKFPARNKIRVAYPRPRPGAHSVCPKLPALLQMPGNCRSAGRACPPQ